MRVRAPANATLYEKRDYVCRWVSNEQQGNKPKSLERAQKRVEGDRSTQQHARERDRQFKRVDRDWPNACEKKKWKIADASIGIVTIGETKWHAWVTEMPTNEIKENKRNSGQSTQWMAKRETKWRKSKKREKIVECEVNKKKTCPK